MDGLQFDALAKRLAVGATRRSLLGVLSAGLAAAMGYPAAAAAKRPRGAICRKHDDCASGACLPRDATGRRYCQAGPGDSCGLDSDCANSVCLNGRCCAGDDVCEEICCSADRPPTETCCPGTGGCCECFYREDPGNEGIECCPPQDVCKSLTNSPAGDSCCHNDEDCVNGRCCWVGMACQGLCCPTPCCNGVCCPSGQECAIAPGQTVATCQPPRACTEDSQCNTAVGETCQTNDGVCCPPDRQQTFDETFEGETMTIRLCCPYGQGPTDHEVRFCCSLPDRCSTSRGGFGRY